MSIDEACAFLKEIIIAHKWPCVLRASPVDVWVEIPLRGMDTDTNVEIHRMVRARNFNVTTTLEAKLRVW